MAQKNGHLTTEQLSTLLDREVSAEEQTRWEAHLSTCQQCQQELADLRQTVALLRALPQPTLPRSFVLPLEAFEAAAMVREVAEPVAIAQAVAPTPLRRAQGRTLNPYVRGVLRTMSTLAAMIGIVFFLSGVLSLHTINDSSSTSAGSAGIVSTSGSSTVPPSLPGPSPHSAVKGATATGTAVQTKEAHSSPTSVPTQVVKPQTKGNKPVLETPYIVQPSGFWFLIFNLSDPAGRVGFGMLLVILGAMGFVLFRRSRRRAVS